LILEYLLATSAVASGWSGYFSNLLSNLGVHLPAAITGAPGTAPGTLFDLPAFLIVIVLTFLLSIGIRESKLVNNLMVLTKVAIVLLFIIVGGASLHSTANWHPFMPHGSGGVFRAAAAAFFAYIGFDAIASASEEARDPGKSLPRAIVLSIVICTVLYVAMTLVMTGLVNYTEFTGSVATHPASFAMERIGRNWVAGFIDLGAITGMTTVIMVMLYGLIRVMFSISRDGMLPQMLAKTHPRFKTPFNATWFFGLIGAFIAAMVPLSTLVDLISIGTLVAFVIVSASVIVLRRTQPDLKRAFRCPWVPVVPILGIITCVVLIATCNPDNFLRFGIWFALGLVIYFLYARKKSKLASGEAASEDDEGLPRVIE
jgi:APA family basic amino acid/polyamine antiporter